MAFSLASSGGAASGTLTGVTAAQGTLIAITAFGVATGNVAVTLTSVTDDTAGGNTYSSIPAVASSAFFATPNQTSSQVTVWALVTNALSANTITVAFSGASVIIASYTVWTGVPAGTTVLATALTAGILANKSSQAVPAAPAPAGGLSIANINLNGSISSFTGGYTVVAPENNMGYLVTAASGLTSTTATFAGASDTWAASNVIFGPPPAPAPPVALAPGWHPGLLLPGLPGGTPFWSPPPATSPVSVQTITGTAAPAGAGAVTAAVTEAVTSAIAGAGAASASGVITGTAALAGAGGVTTAVTQAAPAAATAAGTVTAAVTEIPVAAAAGAGSVTAKAVQSAVAAPAGAGAVASVVTEAVTAIPAGAGAVTASVQGAGATATPAGAGSVTAVVTQPGTAGLAGAGTATARATQAAAAFLAGTGSVTAAAVQAAPAALAGAGGVTAAGHAVSAIQAGTIAPAPMTIPGATAGQMTIPAAVAGQMTLPRAEGGQQ